MIKLLLLLAMVNDISYSRPALHAVHASVPVPADRLTDCMAGSASACMVTFTADLIL